MNLGYTIEDTVEFLCTRSFFADFVVRSPKYNKIGGQEKEAADLLVAFEDTLLAIQVKSKEVDLSANSVSETERKRVSKVVQKAMFQFRSLAEALCNNGFNSFKNGRGVEIQFDKNKIKNLILIVVFAPIWKNSDPGNPSNMRFNLTCYPEQGAAIHLFTLQQFSLLATLMDTLPDFMFYLDARWALHGEKLIPENTDPIDEWAFITFERKKLGHALESGEKLDLSGLHLRHSTSLENLERREKPGYFVDQLIEYLCDSIGATMPLDARFRFLSDPNSQQSYNLLIPLLAKMTREERARLAEFLVSRVRNCRKQEISFRGFKFREQNDEAYLVLASRAERKDRQVALYNIIKGVAFKLSAKTVVGFAVAHDWPTLPDCDVMFLDASKMEVHADLVKFADEGFGRARFVSSRT